MRMHALETETGSIDFAAKAAGDPLAELLDFVLLDRSGEDVTEQFAVSSDLAGMLVEYTVTPGADVQGTYRILCRVETESGRKLVAYGPYGRLPRLDVRA